MVVRIRFVVIEIAWLNKKVGLINFSLIVIKGD